MKSNQTDVVSEYLHEVDLRLSGLPLLQRRELLADLAAHIATERTERNVRSESELIEILERLGSPEVVAAAAYAEAGGPQPAAAGPPPFAAPPPFAPQPPFAAPSFVPAAPGGRKRPLLIAAVLAAVGVIIVLCLGGALALNRGSDSPPERAPISDVRDPSPADVPETP
jgi:hypothetical protein